MNIHNNQISGDEEIFKSIEKSQYEFVISYRNRQTLKAIAISDYIELTHCSLEKAREFKRYCISHLEEHIEVERLNVKLKLGQVGLNKLEAIILKFQF